MSKISLSCKRGDQGGEQASAQEGLWQWNRGAETNFSTWKPVKGLEQGRSKELQARETERWLYQLSRCLLAIEPVAEISPAP